VGAPLALSRPSARAVALTIAGSDSGGGAGVAADLKTFEALGVWGAMAITAVTAQNTTGVQASLPLPPELVTAQIESVAADLDVAAAKTGMLGRAGVVRAVAAALRLHGIGPLVVDPVILSSHGDALLSADGLAALVEELLPLAAVVTPNLAEAAALSGLPVSDRGQMVAAAAIIAGHGAEAVLITGGHLPERESAPDLLWTEAGGPRWLEGERLAAGPTHGTGCVLSAAIAALLARGRPVDEACLEAKAFVAGAIAAGVAIGRGTGPVDPGWRRTSG
jgi:hydroxymethylpyrimidine/phosphomethylpyrimidine kinase